MTVKEAFLDTAGRVRPLLGSAELRERWATPSILAEFAVSGLAGHLARAVFNVTGYLDANVPDVAPVDAVQYFRRLADDGNPALVRNRAIRERGEQDAGPDADDLQRRYALASDSLATRIAGMPADRLVAMAGPSVLRLDEALKTRIIELIVHADDLAASLGLPTPEFDPEATDIVVTTLACAAADKHGPLPVIRALSRTERAPASISAF